MADYTLIAKYTKMFTKCEKQKADSGVFRVTFFAFHAFFFVFCAKFGIFALNSKDLLNKTQI